VGSPDPDPPSALSARGQAGLLLRRGAPVEHALAHLSSTYPLETPEWAAWAANLRPARVEGSWTISGHEPGRGPIFGTMEIVPVEGRPDEFTTEARYAYADEGTWVNRTGMSIVYTGYQWRGRSNPGAEDELREVLTVDRGWTEIAGRWFSGPHDEFGIEVTLRRTPPGPTISGLHPSVLRTGEGPREVRLYGANLPEDLAAGDLDLGPGITIRQVVEVSPEVATLQVEVSPEAAAGRRNAVLRGAARTDALIVHDRVDGIRVTPRAGLARIGGIVVPKQSQQFEAIAFQSGPDGVPGTEDDLELGPIQVEWSLQEYPSTYDDNDVDFVGEIDETGLFTPAEDGPNPERSGNRNNIGTVWVVATYRDPGAATDTAPLTARAYLVVTAPVHIRWDDSPLRDSPLR
jgi:quinohemoprotein amine dehydrogenase